ncbi:MULTISPECIES: DUF1285 domain-containing protein [unclassified Saccharibacter]|uniref:DUF1285 domain-containing protein n=1 Tax=unclassified Saccharibacter TaxID=2648722 RepID=UPI0019266966|nr:MULTISPECIES: DUF1285 domain-containing protein [unclassified Saccharibacter]
MSDYAIRRLAPSLGEDPTEQSVSEEMPRVLPFHIRRDGTWLYRGTAITRKTMLCLFASLLDRDEKGDYWLRTPTEEGIIQVDDVPLMAVELDFRGHSSRHQNLCLRTNMDELLCVGPEHPLICDWDRPASDSTVPYVYVRAGRGKYPIMARLSRPILFELAALATQGHVKGEPCLGVWSQGEFFPLSRLSNEEDEMPPLDWIF